MSKFFVPAQVFEPVKCSGCQAQISNGGKGSVLIEVADEMFPAMVSVERFECMRCMAQKPAGESVPAPMLGSPVVGTKKG